jgi:hypothetical protein
MIESLTSYNRTYVAQSVKLAELAEELSGKASRQISDVHFVNCTILGPAVVVPGDAFRLSGAAYIDDDREEAFRALEPATPYPADAIVVSDCEFEDCSFRDVQFVAPEELVWQLRRHFHPYTPE